MAAQPPAVPSNAPGKHVLFSRWYIGALASIVVVSAVVYFALPHFNTGTTAKKAYRVGIISGLDFFLPTVDGFKQKMTELGYVEGDSIVYDLQKTNFEPAKEQQILKKFIGDKVDLIFSFPTEVSLAAKAATKGTSIPVIFANSFTEGVDIIDSIGKPGGNISGVRFPGADISIKRLEYIHAILPDAKRIWVTYQKDYPPVPPLMVKVRAAAAEMGLELVEVPALGFSDIQADLDARGKRSDIDIDAILGVTEPLAIQGDAFAAIMKFAAEHNLMIGDTAVFPGEEGPLFGVFTNSEEVGRQAAILVDKVFNGIPAGSIPVSSPEAYLRINHSVAQKLNIPISEDLLSQANEILR